MLVLLGPTFDSSEASYQALARATGLVPYDLKTRLKAGSWGCVKVVGDLGQARDLGSRLIAAGFPVVLVDQQVAHDPDRRHVPVHRIELRENDFVLMLKDREMTIPYRALTCIVEGEVQPGRTSATARAAQPNSPSSGSLRAVTPGLSEMQAFRDSQVGYLAADLHFATVLWVARLDTRVFEFGDSRSGSVANDLAALVDRIAALAGVRVDRAVKTSSVAAMAMGEQPVSRRAASWPPLSARLRDEPQDQRFDTYSRLIGEAERLARKGG